jgi:tetratricopeptide (TPR) repeat protein
MTAVKQTTLHMRIAETLLASAGEPEPGQLALHFDRAQIPHKALRFAKAAADRAEETGAAHEAIRFLRIARRSATDTIEATGLLAREAGIRFRQAELEHALPLLAIAEQEFREMGDLESAVQCGLKAVYSACELGMLEHQEALRAVDRLLVQCQAAGSWEHYVETVEMRLRIVERVNDVASLRPSLERLRAVPDTGEVRVRCLTESVRALTLLFGDGKAAGVAAKAAYEFACDFGLRDLQDRALHRLFMVLSLGGTLNAEGEGRLLEEGLRRASVSDAVTMRYRLLEAAGVWNLESGDLVTAERYLKQAEAILRETLGISYRVNMLGNLAELSAMAGNFESARDDYARARDSLRPQDHWRLRQIIHAGLGYCALQLGDLRLARECESQIAYNGEAYFDPWMIVLFKVTLLRRRGSYDTAIDYVHTVAATFESRLRLVVIKLRLLELSLCRGRREAQAQQLCTWLLNETDRLQLATRHAEVRRLISGRQGNEALLDC